MYKTKICPKCACRSIVFAPVPRSIAPVEVACLICSRCGFVEYWVNNPADLKKLSSYHHLSPDAPE